LNEKTEIAKSSTDQNIQDLEAELRNDTIRKIAGLETDLKSHIRAEIRTSDKSTSSSIQTLENTLKMDTNTKIGELRTELESHVQTRIDDLKTSSESYVNIQDLEAALNETSDALYKNIYDSFLVNCPVNNSKYAYINNTCYYFETTKLNHSEAAKNCVSKFGGRNGVLVELKTLSINNKVYLKTKEVEPNRQHWWMGVVRSSDGENFQFQSTSEIVPFSNSNEPWGNGQPLADCALMYYGTDEWNDYPCSIQAMSICESQHSQLQTKVDTFENSIQETIQALKNNSRLLDCPVNNTQYAFDGSTCYFFENRSLSHSEAAENCASKFGGRSGVLFEPTTLKRNNQVSSFGKSSLYN
jgi:hypothetical protein